MKSATWLTPPDWIAALGPFDLDPCCPPDMPWRTAATMLTPLDDGLSAEWSGYVWLNPPFGREAAAWLRKMNEHGNGVALVPARTETAWFNETVWEGNASAVCFVKGRPHFHRADGSRAPFNSGAPIALIGFGERAAEALEDADLGRVIYLAQ